MEQFFKDLSQQILSKVNPDEHVMLNFWGENSHFTRFNQSKVRQNGFVSDATLSITLIHAIIHFRKSQSLAKRGILKFYFLTY